MGEVVETTLAAFLEETTDTGDEYTTAMMYGYSTLAVLAISLLALVGIVFFPFINGSKYDKIMQCIVGVGVGALVSDALLHMIPYVVGVHAAHGDEEEHDHDHEDEEEHTEDISYIWKLCVTLAGIWLFYLFECGMKLWHQRNSDSVKSESIKFDVIKNVAVDEGTITASSKNETTANKNANSDNSRELEKMEGINKETDSDLFQEDKTFLTLTPTCFMLFLGDLLHNFGDGLAIGVAFSVSIASGLGTTFAVFCHELPHEFGDFALYMTHGCSKIKAIGLNLISALCGFVGLYLGLLIAQNSEAQKYLLALIAGFFLYNSLVTVFPEMIEHVTDRPLLTFFLQNVGLLTGWALILLIALFEEDLESALE